MSEISTTDIASTNTSLDLAEIDEREISSRRIFVVLGVAGALFWVVAGAVVYSLF